MELKVMTFNLRVDNAGDGRNAFSNRFLRVIETVLRESPAIVGFQEVTESMAQKVREGLSGYTVLGCGRERDCRGESMLLAYRTDAFSLLSVENVRLSLTPDLPGSRYGLDQSPCPRMFTAVLLQPHACGEKLLFVNTHLDHVGQTARLLGAAQLIQYLRTHTSADGHFVLTGDFNAQPDSPEIRLFADIDGFPITDCTAALPGTFHDFGRIPEEKREHIDYIFTDGACRGAYAVPDDCPDGVYYSDHLAVCATVAL